MSMLSRIAESLFWIGRYVERADTTARILDVHIQLLLEDPWLDGDQVCRALLAITGTPVTGATVTSADVLRSLGIDRANPSSIASSIVAARENARRARETVSSDLWVSLNTTSARLPNRVEADTAHSFFTWARERTALAVGMVEASTSRDEAWQFFTLGRALERADMTARLLGAATLTDVSGPAWTSILRSCGAYEGYLRAYRGMPNARNAAEFLVLDRLFPRSVVWSISMAEQCLDAIEPRRARVGHANPTLRRLGRVRTDLEYTGLDDLIERMDARMIRVQDAMREASNEVSQRYFPTQADPSWIGGAA